MRVRLSLGKYSEFEKKGQCNPVHVQLENIKIDSNSKVKGPLDRAEWKQTLGLCVGKRLCSNR
jgi:hypothetical protein